MGSLDEYLRHFSPYGLPAGVERAFAELASENEHSVFERLKHIASNKVLAEDFWPKYAEIVREVSLVDWVDWDTWVKVQASSLIHILLSKGGKLKEETEGVVAKRRLKIIEPLEKLIRELNSNEDFQWIDLNYFNRLYHDFCPDPAIKDQLRQALRERVEYYPFSLQTLLEILVLEIKRDCQNLHKRDHKPVKYNHYQTERLADKVFRPTPFYPHQERTNLQRRSLFERAVFHHLMHLNGNSDVFHMKDDYLKLVALLEVEVLTEAEVQLHKDADLFQRTKQSWKDYQKHLKKRRAL